MGCNSISISSLFFFLQILETIIEIMFNQSIWIYVKVKGLGFSYFGIRKWLERKSCVHILSFLWLNYCQILLISNIFGRMIVNEYIFQIERFQRYTLKIKHNFLANMLISPYIFKLVIYYIYLKKKLFNSFSETPRVCYQRE